MGNLFLEISVLVAWGLVFYSYAIYPLLLTLVAGIVQTGRDVRYVLGKRERRVGEVEELPRVAVVIAAYNEERHIAARIENLLQLDYPDHLVTIYVGSDGSQDGTDEILAAVCNERVRTLAFAQNRGKSSVLNDLVAIADAPVVVFSDANTFFDRFALRRLLAHFSDGEVGAVTGELRLMRSGGDNQDSLYWRLEQYLKFFEARIGGLLGANGAIYAIRKAFWQPLPADTICDDFCVAMNVAAAGGNLVYEPTAWAFEDTPDAISEEYKRRVRIGIGNFQALVRHPEYLSRTSPGTIFAYLSHKVLRWIAPHLLFVALVASLVLGLDSASWLGFALLQLCGSVTAAMLYRASAKGYVLPKALRIPTFLFALNWALLVASKRFVGGDYGGSWRRTHR